MGQTTDFTAISSAGYIPDFHIRIFHKAGSHPSSSVQPPDDSRRRGPCILQRTAEKFPRIALASCSGNQIKLLQNDHGATSLGAPGMGDNDIACRPILILQHQTAYIGRSGDGPGQIPFLGFPGRNHGAQHRTYRNLSDIFRKISLSSSVISLIIIVKNPFPADRIHNLKRKKIGHNNIIVDNERNFK